MILSFHITYKTFPGQQMMLQGAIPELGSASELKAVYMTLLDAETGHWYLNISLKKLSDFSYRYILKDDNFNTQIEEWGPDRSFCAENRTANHILLTDRWRSFSDPDYALHSSAFTNAILKPGELFPAPVAKAAGKTDSIILKFKPTVIRIKPGHRVAVCGSSKSLGAWKDEKALVLGNPEHPVWDGEVRIPVKDFPVRYKFFIQNEKGETAFWEKSTDRIIQLPDGEIPDVIEIRDEKFDFPQYPWKGTGVAIPVFSLRRRNGFGVGEFTDISLLVDWSVNVGIRMVQILPVNDTVAKHSWMDSYPYAAISVYALHPIYINISEIGALKSEINQQIIDAQGRYLNSLHKIDYEAVMALKSRFFKLFYDQSKKQLLKDPEFLSFFKENEHWLRPYAAFSYLRDLFNTPDFSRWGEYSKPGAELLALLTDENSAHYDDIAVHYFIQFHAYKQLFEAARYARSRGVVLKGDIPIGIYRNSVDAWLSPELYHMDRQAGAPPDDFSAKGQNWRFPTYNWEEMAKDNYGWWQQRLRQLSGYFDAFRIDHILGFFRIWEIPSSQVEGLLGYFNPSLPFYRDDLQERGIWFDEQRLCKPYIREHFLYERFGELMEEVKYNFLEEYAPGCYNLREEYNTQSKIEQKLVVEPDASPWMRNRIERMIQGLNSLVAEVLFLHAPDTGDNGYFPRNALHFTRSYQELDGHTKHAINQVYLEYFYQRNEEFWRGKAMTKLPVIKKATNMLLCGEDLGMVPACVPSVMNELGILSLEVQRMPKDIKVAFGHPASYPYLSVATPSSHDTSTIRGWWEEDPARSQKFYYEILGNHGPSPYFCEPDIVRQIIVQHLYSPSMWAVFPIQDLLGMDGKIRLKDAREERINNPGNPNHYWRYRLHLNLEDLLELDGFNESLKDMILQSGRLEIY
ncbi:MAG: 4-alpha-glucanotransferase [Bacteroidales bacterium]|nr:4-alpha-glucanotransferase [Bacteroidales bacterium]